ncbi:MAG: hypothetical protein MI861_26710, partial [Pirellulales bacterium]|nr:hypothetical protein [Pirellulales bacterium]
EAESESPLTSSVEQSEDRKRDSVWKPAAAIPQVENDKTETAFPIDTIHPTPLSSPAGLTPHKQAAEDDEDWMQVIANDVRRQWKSL